VTRAAGLSLVVVGRGTPDNATGRVAGGGGVGIILGATGEGGAMIIAEAAGGGTIVATTTG
jgi:hypothetical protein